VAVLFELVEQGGGEAAEACWRWERGGIEYGEEGAAAELKDAAISLGVVIRLTWNSYLRSTLSSQKNAGAWTMATCIPLQGNADICAVLPDCDPEGYDRMHLKLNSAVGSYPGNLGR